MAPAAPFGILTSLHRHRDSGGDIVFPQRPVGPVIWARCATLQDYRAVQTLVRRLSEDGDQVYVVCTVADGVADAGGWPEPVGQRQNAAFLAHWRPDILLWSGGAIDPDVLIGLKIPVVLTAAQAPSAATLRRWLPGYMRRTFAPIRHFLVADNAAKRAMIRAGADAARVRVIGQLEDNMPTLPYREADRRDMAEVLATRPAWLAAGAAAAEASVLAKAHRQASRRAHRLLLIAALQDHGDLAAIQAAMEAEGLRCAIRADNQTPDDATQVYIVDADMELGLWYRLAPITYIGGSLTEAATRDPFEAAALGSAVVHGPKMAGFAGHSERLDRVGGARPVSDMTELAIAVEVLLSTDRAAMMAHAAWDVTTRGSEATHEIVGVLQTLLDQAGT